MSLAVDAVMVKIGLLVVVKMGLEVGVAGMGWCWQ